MPQSKYPPPMTEEELQLMEQTSDLICTGYGMLLELDDTIPIPEDVRVAFVLLRLCGMIRGLQHRVPS